jgi:hypothetical protein
VKECIFLCTGEYGHVADLQPNTETCVVLTAFNLWVDG